MTKISILYPNANGSKFDFSYYLETHMPLALRLLGAHLGYLGVSVERGVGGGAPGSDPTYIAMCHFLFNSAEDFMAAFGPNAAALQGDIPNFTDIEPIIQVSDVLLVR